MPNYRKTPLSDQALEPPARGSHELRALQGENRGEREARKKFILIIFFE
jgi:hypothetical protein